MSGTYREASVNKDNKKAYIPRGDHTYRCRYVYNLIHQKCFILLLKIWYIMGLIHVLQESYLLITIANDCDN